MGELLEPGGATLTSGEECGNDTLTVGPTTLPASGTCTALLIIDTTAKGGGQLKIST